MILIVNDLCSEKDCKSYLGISSIKPQTPKEEAFLNDILTTNYQAIIINIDNSSAKMLKLVIFLMDLRTNIIVLTNKYKTNRLKSLLGINVITSLNKEEVINYHATKNTIPNINNVIENGLKKIEAYLEEYPDISRFMAMQILYENAFFKNYYDNNIFIQMIKEDIDKKLKYQTVEIIDKNIETFLKQLI